MMDFLKGTESNFEYSCLGLLTSWSACSPGVSQVAGLSGINFCSFMSINMPDLNEYTLEMPDGKFSTMIKT